MQTSCQEGFEWPEHAIPDEVVDLFKRLHYRGPPCWPYMVEEYLDRKIGVHVHATLGHAIGECDVTEYCLVFQAAHLADAISVVVTQAAERNLGENVGERPPVQMLMLPSRH